MDDVELLKRTASGDQSAFATLVRRYQERLLRYCYRYLRDTAQAEDAVQEVFYRVYNFAPQFEPRASVSAFIFKVATNICLDELKARKRQRVRLPLVSFDSVTDAGGENRSMEQVVASNVRRPEEILLLEEALGDLEAALEKLPPRHRKAIEMYELDNLSYKDIAENLGATLAEVKIWIFRARKKLSSIMNEEEENECNE